MLIITLKVLASVMVFLPIANTSPTASLSPNSDDLIPQEYIDEVLTYFSKRSERLDNKPITLDVRSTLQKRIPVNQRCDNASHWLSRQCRSDVGPRAYQDECQHPNGINYYPPGLCQEGTFCAEALTDDNGMEDLDIICVPATPPREDNIGRKKQYGYKIINAVSSLAPTSIIQPIRLITDVASSSTTAHLRSADGNYVVMPIYQLTAISRLDQTALCKENKLDDHNDRRTCRPTKRVDLKMGNIIDFTFGLTNGQSVILFYAIASLV